MNEAPTVRLATHAMATRFELVIHGDDPVRLRAAGEEAVNEIERLARQLSAYEADSEVTWINARAAGGPVRVSAELLELLQTAASITQAVDGAFDVTIAPLLAIWGFTGERGRMPSDEQIEAARSVVGMHLVELDSAASVVRFARDGVRVDLGAIGKGYAIDRAAEVLRDCGVTSALIHGGTSTVYAIGGPPGAEAWRVALCPSPQPSPPWGEGAASGPGAHSGDDTSRPPSSPWGEGGGTPDVIELRDSSVSVSAPHGRSFVQDGVEYGHIIDPRTGRPARTAALAAVTGPSATATDALSTALLVLGAGWLPVLETRFPGYKGIVVEG